MFLLFILFLFATFLIITTAVAKTPKNFAKKSILIIVSFSGLLSFLIGIVYFIDYIESEPGNAIQSSYPALKLSEYEVIYEESFNGMFGGGTTILLKLPDSLSESIIQNCEDLGYFRIKHTDNTFGINIKRIIGLNHEKLGIGEKPACKSKSSRIYNNPYNLPDERTFILDNGYLYYHSSYL
ncbi:hypothetical protein WH95_01595 [Kiloniella litopenaei]|uniref:Uncharacterized protein n=1 Tax=Kiloniella litopenaei TaxID=1549748 RepID=A0A0M2RAW3_9PROT|nr:hypothetical protein [Kiloniella litopenaei]KKJ78786.1 hypothetical protein WH95_01595 [Kiloniella litopenaei]